MLPKAMTGFVASGLLLSGQAALADHNDWRGERYDRPNVPEYDYARVVHVDPIVRQVRVSEPRRECWNETRYEEVRNDRQYEPVRGSAGSMILGGIIGAALGNQIGSGDGRRAATVAGAIIGSAVGHDAAARREARKGYAYADQDYRESRPYEVERCKVFYEASDEERVEGYRVTYVYNGHEHTTRLPYDPGDRIRVRVDIQPEDCN